MVLNILRRGEKCQLWHINLLYSRGRRAIELRWELSCFEHGSLLFLIGFLGGWARGLVRLPKEVLVVLRALQLRLLVTV